MHSPEGLGVLTGHRCELILCGHTHGGQIALPGGRAIWGSARSLEPALPCRAAPSRRPSGDVAGQPGRGLRRAATAAVCANGDSRHHDQLVALLPGVTSCSPAPVNRSSRCKPPLLRWRYRPMSHEEVPCDADPDPRRTDSGAIIAGLTTHGRATVIALNLNRPALVRSRRLWIRAGWHPPTE